MGENHPHSKMNWPLIYPPPRISPTFTSTPAPAPAPTPHPTPHGRRQGKCGGKGSLFNAAAQERRWVDGAGRKNTRDDVYMYVCTGSRLGFVCVVWGPSWGRGLIPGIWDLGMSGGGRKEAEGRGAHPRPGGAVDAYLVGCFLCQCFGILRGGDFALWHVALACAA